MYHDDFDDGNDDLTLSILRFNFRVTMTRSHRCFYNQVLEIKSLKYIPRDRIPFTIFYT